MLLDDRIPNKLAREESSSRRVKRQPGSTRLHCMLKQFGTTQSIWNRREAAGRYTDCEEEAHICASPRAYAAGSNPWDNVIAHNTYIRRLYRR